MNIYSAKYNHLLDILLVTVMTVFLRYFIVTLRLIKQLFSSIPEKNSTLEKLAKNWAIFKLNIYQMLGPPPRFTSW